MTPEHTKRLREIILDKTLEEYLLQRKLPDRTGAILIDIKDFLDEIGAVRLSGRRFLDALEVVNDVLRDGASFINFNGDLQQFSVHLRTRLAMHGNRLFIGQSAIEVPKSLLTKHKIKIKIKGA